MKVWTTWLRLQTAGYVIEQIWAYRCHSSMVTYLVKLEEAHWNNCWYKHSCFIEMPCLYAKVQESCLSSSRAEILWNWCSSPLYQSAAECWGKEGTSFLVAQTPDLEFVLGILLLVFQVPFPPRRRKLTFFKVKWANFTYDAVRYYSFLLYEFYSLIVGIVIPWLTEVLFFSELQNLKSVICVCLYIIMITVNIS